MKRQMNNEMDKIKQFAVIISNCIILLLSSDNMGHQTDVLHFNEFFFVL